MTPSDLCVACGMCCDGTMFGNVVAQDHELVQMIFLGAETKYKEEEDKHFFLQPCPAHINGSCSIYETRPKTCSGYKCHLLKRVLRNELSPERALVKVERLKKAKKDLGINSVQEARKLKTPEGDQFVKDMHAGFYGPTVKKNDNQKQNK
jgi:Fe-S-cluster containining protein